jgi:hypothetical protein
MAMPSPSLSPLCRPESDLFLLLASTFHARRTILKVHWGRSLSRSRFDRPYGEESRSWRRKCSWPSAAAWSASHAESDEWLLLEMEFMARCRLADERLEISCLKPVLA